MRILGPLLLLLCSCYTVDTTPGKFRCDQPADTCPSPLICAGGQCVSRGDEPRPAGPADMVARPADLAPAAAAGCAGPGMILGRDGALEVYACRGQFGAGQAGSLCHTGFHVCSTSDAAILVPLDRDGRCGLLAGFFAAQIEAAIDDAGAASCPPAAGLQNRVIPGCGTLSGTGDSGVRELRAGCQGLTRALPCGAPVSGWSCSARLQDASHTDPQTGGTLCCKG